jgi:chromate transporter
MSVDIDATPSKERRSFFEVFWLFLRLGVTSFGGPIAHLAYFRAEFAERRTWLDEAAYTDIIALCQFRPGPAISQVFITSSRYRL